MHCKFLSSRGVWEKFFSRKKRVDCDVRKNRWQSLSNDLPRWHSRRRRSYIVFSFWPWTLVPSWNKIEGENEPLIPPPTQTINIHRWYITLLRLTLYFYMHYYVAEYVYSQYIYEQVQINASQYKSKMKIQTFYFLIYYFGNVTSSPLVGFFHQMNIMLYY